MILELVNKLGYRGDKLAEVRTLAMMGDAAESAKDFERAAEMCERMVEVVERMRKVAGKGKERRPESISVPSSLGTTPSSSTKDLPPSEEAASFAWRSCLQLGRNTTFENPSRRMQVLGQALVLCPPDQISEILPVWTETEKEVAKENRRKKLEEIEAKAKGGEKDAVAAAATAAGAGAVRVANFLAAAASSASNSTSHRNSPSPSPAPPGTFGSTSPRGHSSSPSRSRLISSNLPQASHLAHEASAAASHTLRRAAAYFPFSQSSHPSSTYTFSTDTAPSPSPPPTPPKSADLSPPSSPPSRFASAFDSLSHERSPSRASHLAVGGGGGGAQNAGGFRAGLSSRFTQGVGWLIGADELLERERQEGRA